MKRRQMRWILVLVPTVVALCLMVVAPVADAVTAHASPVPAPSPAAPATFAPPVGALLVPPGRSQSPKKPNDYSGYYENLVGALKLTSTITVPTVKCTNSATWGTVVGLLALANSNVSGEHGGGVEVGCAPVTGTPSYAAALCDPSFPKGCGALADVVLPGDTVAVTVTAAGGCNPACASVVVTVKDTTQSWTESWSGSSSQSDFDTFVVAVGASPLADFGKVTLTNVTSNGARFQGQKFNLIDNAGHTLARAGNLSQAKTSFSVKWLRAA